MPATVTAFYTFTPNTTAKSAEVNNNFSVFRGSVLPIGSATAAAVDNAYDVGSSTYRFLNGYFAGAVYFGEANTTGGWRIKIGDTTTELVFQSYSSTAYVTRGSFNA